MFMYLYDPVNDLKEYNYRVNSFHRTVILTSNLNSYDAVLQVLGTTSKHNNKKKGSQRVFIYLIPFLCCYLWYL